MKQYIIILFVLLGLSSCNDFLDNANDGFNSTDDLDYTDKSQMFNPVSGVYDRMNYNYKHFAVYATIGIRSDDYADAAIGDQATLIYAKNFQYANFETFFGLEEGWRNFYNVAFASNAGLISLDKYMANLQNDADKKLNLQYQAELRFLRAYSYFFLVRLFGDVPIIEVNNAHDLINATKSSRLEVYKYINDELDFCIANLPAVRPNEMGYKGQATQLSALALKAKANADINNWTEVEKLTDAVIATGKMSLYPDFYNLFKKSGRLSNESLFELQYTDAFGATRPDDFLPGVWFQFQSPRFASNNPFSTENGWGFMTPSDNLISFYKNRDEAVRYKTTILYAGTTTSEGDILAPMTSRRDSVYSGKAYFPSKEMNPAVVLPGSGNNIRLLRYADVLLLNAEAKVRNGKNGDTPFNLVRTRAEMSTLSNVTVDQILDERRAEFATEWGERFFDLVRTGKAASVLPGFQVGKSEFYPIPLSQRDLNPNL